MATESHSAPTHGMVSVIEPPRRWPGLGIAELWSYRDLVYNLAWRDVAVRYKQTFVGALWAVLQPVGLAAVYSIFLGRLTTIDTGGVRYAPFALTGMTLWIFLTTSVTRSSESTIQSAELISKVYF